MITRHPSRVEPDLRTLPDYEERVQAARSRAQWELGDASWAGVILAAFLDPKADAADLRAKKAGPR